MHPLFQDAQDVLRTHSKAKTRARILLWVTLILGAVPTVALAQTTVVFQQGASGYTGTRDVWLNSDEGGDNYGNATEIWVDDSPDEHGLLRFEGIIGAGAGQVPAGSVIVSATLEVYVINPGLSSSTVSLHRMVGPWDETDTWNSMGSGVQTNDSEALSAVDATLNNPSISGTMVSIDVRTSVQAWASGTTNRGWAFFINNSDGWDFLSSEDSNASLRPRLTVQYTDPVHKIVVNSITDVADGDTLSIAQLILDDGPDNVISLREAMIAANNTPNAAEPDTIYFAIGTGLQTITPLSPLPPVTDPVLLDATSQPVYSGTPLIQLSGGSSGSATAGIVLRTSDSTVRGFIIHSFPDEGLEVDAGYGPADDNSFLDNWLGINDAFASRPNLDNGILITDGSARNRIQGNIICSSSSHGILIRDAGGDDNEVFGNLIGVTPDTLTARANGGHGVAIDSLATGTKIGGVNPGEPNVILNNTGDGVHLALGTGSGHEILGNRIFGNGGLGIDIGPDGVTLNDGGTPPDQDGGPNGTQNFPVLSSVLVASPSTTTVSGTLTSTPNTLFRLEFFATGAADLSTHGEADRFLGSGTGTTDVITGILNFSETLAASVAVGETVTATATDPNGSTSEFSVNLAAVAAQADLSVTKDVDNLAPDENDTVTYTITVRNNGPNDATGIQVTDLLPSGVSYSGDVASQGSYASGSGIWSVGSLANGVTATLDIDVVVDPGTLGNTILNTASVTAVDQTDPNGTNDSASTTFTVSSGALSCLTGSYVGDGAATQSIVGLGFAPVVVMVKADDGQEAVLRTSSMSGTDSKQMVGSVALASDRIVSLDGNGFTVGSNDQVNRSGVTYHWVAFRSDASALRVGSYPGDGALDREVLGIGFQPQIVFVMSAAADEAMFRVSTALPAFDFDGGPAENSVLTTPLPADGFRVTNDSRVNSAGVTYHYVCWKNVPGRQRNNGYLGDGFDDRDETGMGFQPEFAIVHADLGGRQSWMRFASVGGSDQSFRFGPSGRTTNRIKAFLPDGVRVSDDDDVNRSGDAYSYLAWSRYAPTLDLALTKTVSDSLPNEGEPVVFSIGITNEGPVDATGVEVTDLLPVGLSFDTAVVGQGSYDSGTGVWTVGALANAASVTLDITAIVDVGTQGTIITNTAAVTATSAADPDPADDSASADIRVLSSDLNLTKSVDVPIPNETDTVVYRVTLQNNGPDPASGVAVTDLLPAGLTYVSDVASLGTYDSGTGVWTIGPVPNAVITTLDITATVDAGTAGSTLTNTASITAVDQADPAVGDESDSADITVQSVNLVVNKTVDDTTPDEGETVVYRVTLSNAGPDSASGIDVTDALPSGVTFVSSVASVGSYDSGSGIWSLVGLGAGNGATLDITATVDGGTGGTTITNTAAMTAVDQVDTDPANDSDSVDIDVQSVDLQVVKVVDDASPGEGDTIVYTVTLTNAGPSTATGIVVTDNLPAGLTFQAAVASQGTYNSVLGTWTVGSLANGASVTLDITATINAGMGGSTITNTASVTAVDQPDGDAGNDSDSAGVTVFRVDLVITKTVDQPTPNEGDTIVYRITARNDGPSGATGVSVRDVLPAGVTFQSASATQGSYSLGTDEWSVGSLANGAQERLDLTVTVDAGSGGTTVTNTASLSGVDQDDDDSSNDSDSVDITVQLSDLSLAKSVDISAPNEGNTIVYTVTLQNGGPSDATGIEVTDLLPAGVSLASATAGQGSYDGGTGVWTVGALANGNSLDLDITATVDAGTSASTITNVATITATDQADSTSSNDTASVDITVQSVDLSLSKTVDLPAPNEGGTIVYRLTLTNAGPNTATNIAVTDNLPAGVTFQSASASQGSYDDGTGVWSAGTLAASTAATLDLTATVDAGTAGTAIDNNAAVSAVDQVDSDGSNDSDVATITVQSVDLSVAKTVDTPTPDEGASIVYRITVTNGGPDTATGIGITDALPAGVTFQSSLASAGAFDDGTGIWTIPSLASSASATLDITVGVDTATATSTITNTASITALDQADSDSGNDTDSVDIAVLGADLRVTKSADTVTPFAGDPVVYTVSVENGGPDDATGVSLQDLLPAGLTFVSALAGQGSYDDGTGIWTVGGLSNGTLVTLQITANVDAGTGGSTLTNTASVSAVDQGDPDSSNDSASVDIDSIDPLAGGIVVQTLPLFSRMLLPGAPATDLLRLEFTNNTTVLETLDTLTLTSVTQGDGTLAQMDASWSELSLAVESGPPLSSMAAPTIVTGGTCTFANLGLSLDPGQTSVLLVRGGASIAARDGDLLGLQVLDASGVSATPAPPVLASFPLDGPQHTVDGMTSYQVGVHDVGPGTLTAGGVHRLVLSLTLPSNGYEADVLERINLINLGTARAETDITSLEGWLDDGDDVFDPALDTMLGTFSFTGDRWELTGLSRAVPVGGVRVFISATLAGLALEGRSVQLALPPEPDVGFGMASLNDGPIDQQVPNPYRLIISASDRVALSAGTIPGGVARPGDSGLLVMRLTAANDYAEPRVINSLSLTNATTAAGAASQSNLDSEIQRLHFIEDANDDGILDAGDPEIATVFFSDGRASVVGLDWSLPAGEVRQLFVTADVSATMAADGDLLGVRLDSVFDVRFDVATMVAAEWPVDSAGRWLVDGMIASQVANVGAPPLTLGPNDGPVLAMDLVLPANGYEADVLQALEVENLGTAQEQDLALVELFLDDGDGIFSPSSDPILSPLVSTGQRWRSLPLSEPVPLGGLHVFVGVSMAKTPADSASLQLSVPVGGVIMASGNSGPLDQAVDNADRHTLSSAPLLVEISVDPPISSVGQAVTTTMRVRNVSGELIRGITPSALISTGAGSVGLPTGPSPSTLDLSPAAEGTFVWTHTAAGAGKVVLSGSAEGTGDVSSLSRRSLVSDSNQHRVFEPVTALQLFPVGSRPFVVNRGQSNVVPLALTFVNGSGPDAADARLRQIRVRVENAGAGDIVPADLATSIVVSEGTDVYSTVTALPTSGADVDLVFDQPLVVTASEPVTISVRLDLAATTTEPDFRLVVEAGASMVAENVTNDAPVPVVLGEGTYPVKSALGTIITPPTGLAASSVPLGERGAVPGTAQVDLLAVELENQGVGGLTTDARLGHLTVRLVDDTGTAIALPGEWIERIRLRDGLFVLADLPVEATAGPDIVLPLSPVRDFAVGTPAVLTVAVDLRSDVPLGTIRLQLAEATQQDARDANTGAPVPIVYASDPLEGDRLRIETAADGVMLGAVSRFGAETLVGATDVRAFDVTVRHPGGVSVSPIQLSGLTVRSRNGQLSPLVPSTFVDRLVVHWNDTPVVQLDQMPTSGNLMTLPDFDVSLAPGETANLTVFVDVDASAPVELLELTAQVEDFDFRDANSTLSIEPAAETGFFLPVSSGLTQLLAPATELVVDLESGMPAVLVASSDGVVAGSIALENPAAAGAGSIEIDRLELLAADGQQQAVALGAEVERVSIYRDGSLWGQSEVLTDDVASVWVDATAPLVLGPGESEDLEVRLDLHERPSVASLRVGIQAAGVGIVQPGGGLLQVQVEAGEGLQFPLWTEAGSFSGVSLEESYSNFPNPFAAGRERTTFVYNLTEGGAVTLRILSSRGEVVRTLLDAESRGPGLYQADAWDGRNGKGRPVINGVYVAELLVESGGGLKRLLRKVAVLR